MAALDFFWAGLSDCPLLGGDGGCLGGLVLLMAHGLHRVPAAHEQAELAAWISDHAEVEVAAQPEGATEVQGVGEILRVEAHHRWLALCGHRHLQASCHLLAVAMRQRKVAGCLEAEPHVVDVRPQRPQPRDERRAAILGERDGFVDGRRDDLPVVRIAAVDALGDQGVGPRAELHVLAADIVILQDSGIAGGEVRMPQHVNGGVG